MPRESDCRPIRQFLVSGNHSLIIIDLKADSPELMTTPEEAAIAAGRRSNATIPVEQVTNQTQRATYTLNPMLQRFWRDFELQMRTHDMAANRWCDLLRPR